MNAQPLELSMLTVAMGFTCAFTAPPLVRHGPLCDHGMIYAVRFDPKRSVVWAAGRLGRSGAGLLCAYDLNSGRRIAVQVHSAGDERGALRTLDISSDGTTLVATDEAGNVLVFRASSEESSLRLSAPATIKLPASAWCVRALPGVKRAAAGCGDGRVRVVDLSTAAIVAELDTQAGVVTALAAHNGLFAAGTSPEGIVVVFDATTYRRIAQHSGVRSVVSALEFIDGERVAIGRSFTAPLSKLSVPARIGQEQLTIWRLGRPSVERAVFVGGDGVTSISLGARHKLLAAGYTHLKAGSPNAVIVLNCATWTPVCTVRGRWRAPLVALSPTAYLLCIADGRYAELWDISTRAKPQRLWQSEWHWWDYP